jgi:hypothetical protein
MASATAALRVGGHATSPTAREVMGEIDQCSEAALGTIRQGLHRLAAPFSQRERMAEAVGALSPRSGGAGPRLEGPIMRHRRKHAHQMHRGHHGHKARGRSREPTTPLPGDDDAEESSAEGPEVEAQRVASPGGAGRRASRAASRARSVSAAGSACAALCRPSFVLSTGIRRSACILCTAPTNAALG